MTLHAMAFGGMHDQIGGGFHRYSVDAEWRVPHFEKMLYDQAQLVLAYLEAAQASGDSFYADVAADTLAYVERDLTDAEGGFYSAEDADSVPPDDDRSGGPSGDDDRGGGPSGPPHKMEGAFYIWRDEEIQEVLGADAARLSASSAERNPPSGSLMSRSTYVSVSRATSPRNGSRVA
jgi:uncharacterized protein YyaL (SSP411 family)